MAAGKADAAAAPGSVRLSLPMSSSRRTFIKHLPFLYSLPGTLAAAPKSGLLEQRLLASFERLEIADTHEHFFDERDRISQHVDFFTFAQGYTTSDLVSAGLSAESSRLIRNEQAPEMERWQAFEKYWKYTRYTGYGQALRLAVHDLYGGKTFLLPRSTRSTRRSGPATSPGFTATSCANARESASASKTIPAAAASRSAARKRTSSFSFWLEG